MLKGIEMLKRIILAIFLIIMQLSGSDNSASHWTWVHHMRCNDIVRATNRSKKALFFEKEKTSHFTQLVFSWNAMRPEQGHFSFYVQVRNAETQKWGVWHHMADWGAGMQQSHLSKSDGFSSFVHVRLEVENKKVADAFRIKIIPHKNASLGLMHSCSVAISNFNTFKAEQIISNALLSVHVEGVPAIAQFALEHEDNSRICSPVSCTMLVHYVTGQHKDPLEFAAKAFDSGLEVYGSWPCNMAHAFEECGGKMAFFVRRMNGFADIHQQLIKDIPVAVSVRGSLPGALKSFPHGHLMVVVGWDNEAREVLCHDPAAESHEKVFKRYPIADFLRAWECSHRLAYVAGPVDCIAIK
jgi:hypothetical protein